MRPASALLTISLCFGAGLGIAPALPTAHAWTCDSPPRRIQLIDVDAEGQDALRIAEETATWATEGFVNEGPRYTLWFQSNDTSLEVVEEAP